MAYLLLDPGGEDRRFPLEERTTLGRDGSNQIRLDDEEVERFHCRIERTSTGVYKLIDLETAGGTLLNGQPVSQKVLRGGDLIEVGPFTLQFRGSRASTMRFRTPVVARKGSRRRKPSGRRTRIPRAPSSTADVARRAIEQELREMLENIRELFGDEGLQRAAAVFGEFGIEPPEVDGALESRRDRLLQVMEINQALTEELDLGRLLEKILDSIVALVDAEQALVVMYDENGRMTIPAGRNVDRESLTGPGEYEVSRNLIEKVRQTGEMIHCHDALEHEEFDAFLSVSNLRLRSILCVPLVVGEEVGGVIYVENRLKPRAFDDGDAQVICAFSHQAAIAIHNARQREEILASNRNLKTLNKVGKAISSTLELDPLLELIVGKTIDVSDANRTYLMLVNHSSGKLEFKLGRNQDNEPLTADDFEVSTTMVKKAVKRRRTVLTVLDEDAAEFSAVMAVPMFVRDELLGVIYADKEGHQPPFTREQASLVEQFADQAKIAIHNAYLYARATIDSLTKLYKRSYLDQRLEEELSRAERYRHPVTLLMLDLDHFKQLNDTHGHLAGDDVLRLVGHIIKTSLRGHDIAARYGGEEFSVIMPQLELAGAVKVAKRIKRRLQHQTRLPYELTISIGAAELQAGQTPEELIGKADRALYRAKHTGRNKVCTWRPGGGSSRRLELTG